MVLEWRRLAPSLVVLVAEIVVAVVVAIALDPPNVQEFVLWDATLDSTYQANSSIPVRGVTTSYLGTHLTFVTHPGSSG
jgi:hypothetical protein